MDLPAGAVRQTGLLVEVVEVVVVVVVATQQAAPEVLAASVVVVVVATQQAAPEVLAVAVAVVKLAQVVPVVPASLLWSGNHEQICTYRKSNGA